MEYGSKPRLCEECGGFDFAEVGPRRSLAEDDGSSLSPPPEATDCPHCGQPAPLGEGTCFYCGERLRRVVGDAIGAVAQLVAPDGAEIPLYEGVVERFGRNPEESPWSRLAEGNMNVSRVHAEIEVREGRLHIRDICSTNGTWVRGIRIDGFADIALEDGICIGLGTRLNLLVRLP